MGRYVKKKKCWNVFVHVGAIEENPPWAFSMETGTRVLTAIRELSVSSEVVLVRAFGKPLTHSKRSKWKAFGRNFFPSFASFFYSVRVRRAVHFRSQLHTSSHRLYIKILYSVLCSVFELMAPILFHSQAQTLSLRTVSEAGKYIFAKLWW